MMTGRLLLAAAAAMIIGMPAARAQDAAAGEALYKSNCRQCHGPTARGMSAYPRLSDKEADYIVGRLGQYRAGERVGPNSPLMYPVAKDLTDAEIADLAVFISGIE
jgi:cytochrome c553